MVQEEYAQDLETITRVNNYLCALVVIIAQVINRYGADYTRALDAIIAQAINSRVAG